MIHLVAYSGGLSSFAVADYLVRQYGPESVLCVFTDTRTEDEDLYRFLDDTERFLGCGFVRLADGRNIWEVFRDVRFQGNSRIDPCSKILKREIFRQWLGEHHSPGSTTLYYGIGAHEAHRIKSIRERWAPYAVEAPLIDFPLTQDQIIHRLEEIDIVPPRLYEMGFEHNNCGGFCVKTGQRQMKLLLEVMPERYAWHEAQQDALFAEIGPHGFIRKTTDGQLAYLSLKQFRQMVERGEKVQMFEDGACACFS